MRPAIGVTPDFAEADREEREPTLFLRSRYARAIELAGGLPFILSLTSDPRAITAYLDRLDGVMVTGSGPDLDPRLYGERPVLSLRLMSRVRARFELALVKAALKADLPVLGVCGGMQLLNVALGGTLYQDLLRQRRGALRHQSALPARLAWHRIEIQPESRLHAVLRRRWLRVNSAHHQAVKKVARGLTASAHSPDGVVEAVELPRRRFVLGVQWHPECQEDEGSRRLFRAFLAASRAGR